MLHEVTFKEPKFVLDLIITEQNVCVGGQNLFESFYREELMPNSTQNPDI